jgi:hypothetical protein
MPRHFRKSSLFIVFVDKIVGNYGNQAFPEINGVSSIA